MGFLARPIRYSFLAKDLRNNRQSGGLNGQVTTAFVRSYGENNSRARAKVLAKALVKIIVKILVKPLAKPLTRAGTQYSIS
jgi:hypothetical protein